MWGRPVEVEVPLDDVPPGLINLLFGGLVSGEVGYQAYCESVGGRAFNGDALPRWEDVPGRIRDAWDHAAAAIVAEACRAADKPSAVDECGCGG